MGVVPGTYPFDRNHNSADRTSFSFPNSWQFFDISASVKVSYHQYL